MTTAITMNPAITIARVHKKSVDLESTPSLKDMTRQLAGVTNKETPLRLKVDDSGHARLKLMPERQSFLTKMFSGIRYAKEAAHASEYFGLTGKATAGAALSKTTPLTETLAQAIGNPFEALTPFELQDLQAKLPNINDRTVLQIDNEGNLRTVRPGTDKKQVDLAQTYFGLEEKPTVAAAGTLIAAKLSRLLQHVTYKDSYNAEIAPRREVHFNETLTIHTLENAASSSEEVPSRPGEEATAAFDIARSSIEVASFIDLVTLLHEKDLAVAKVLARVATELSKGLHGDTSPGEHVDQALHDIAIEPRKEMSQCLLAAYACFSKIGASHSAQ